MVVVPKEEDLKIESAGCVCEVDGCAKLFKGSAQLHMHFIKHHQGRKLGVKSGSSVFYCPVENCDRGVSSGKPFPRLGQLKQVLCAGYETSEYYRVWKFMACVSHTVQ